MGGRFNKILEFIGLVDDEPEDDIDQGSYGRPSSGQTYGAQGRRQPQQAPGRTNRMPEYEDARGRYISSARPDYDARQRRNEYQSSRYGAGADARSDYRASARPEYDRQGAGYRAQDYRQSDYRAQPSTQRPDPLRDEFERAERAERVPPRAARTEPDRSRDNVVPMTRAASATPQTVIYYLRQLEECRDVINDLIDNKTVVLNLEDMDERVIQRGIDTLCGAAFALNATLRKASDKTFLIAPNSVEVASTNDTERRF